MRNSVTKIIISQFIHMLLYPAREIVIMHVLELVQDKPSFLPLH